MQNNGARHRWGMARIFVVLLSLTGLLQPTLGQAADTPEAYLKKIRAVVASERSGTRLVQRLDSLAAAHMPSRSYLKAEFNRDIDLGFTQRRLAMSLNFYRFRLSLLCRNDTIFLSTINWEEDKKQAARWYNQAVIAEFLRKRNQLYNSSKTVEQLLADLELVREYAFYCGDGSPLTPDGAEVNRLAVKRKIDELTMMLHSFTCETQAYGVAGLQQVQRRGYRLPTASQALVAYIKARNSELSTCAGCLSGVVRRIYSQP